MKIFAISDIHGEKKYLNAAAELIGSSDLVVLAGDFSNIGNRKSAEELLSCIEQYNTNILAVHGNWDKKEVADLLEEKGYGIHGKGRIINGTGFFGVGGSNETPLNSASEYTEEAIMEFLETGYREIRDAESIVLISHTPPRKIRDKTFFGLSGGSASIANFVRRNHVDLCICGHIHEAAGIEYLDDCIVVNTGPIKKGKYSIIEIDDSVSVKLGKLK
jgi:Icc-related predicted phosphoesterase